MRLSLQGDQAPHRFSVPDEQLHYVLDGALRTALDHASPGAGIEIVIAGPGTGTAGKRVTDQDRDDAATVEIVVRGDRPYPAPPRSAADTTRTGADLNQGLEVRLLAELTAFYTGRFTASREPESGNTVLSLILPVSGQGTDTRD